MNLIPIRKLCTKRNKFKYVGIFVVYCFHIQIMYNVTLRLVESESHFVLFLLKENFRILKTNIWLKFLVEFGEKKLFLMHKMTQKLIYITDISLFQSKKIMKRKIHHNFFWLQFKLFKFLEFFDMYC